MEMVRMVHPLLDGRIIDVPDSAVQHLVMSGWKRADPEESSKVIKDLEERLALEKNALAVPAKPLPPSSPVGNQVEAPKGTKKEE